MTSSAAVGPGLEHTGRTRIRDAAIVHFGERGVDGTSLKVIAAEAGVSPALIIHHFGSKDGLRHACDHYVAETLRETKLQAFAQGSQLDPVAALRQVGDGRPLLRYLARTLGDGSPQVADLLDEMVDDAVEYMAEGERTGLIKPSAYPRQRAVVLLMWSLGALTLHEHVERLLGVDLLGEPQDLGPYVLPVMELFSRGVMHDELYQRMRESFADPKDGKS